MKCPRCRLDLIPIRNSQFEDEPPIPELNNGEYICGNPKCRKEHQFPHYFGFTQEDIDNNVV